MKRFLLLAFLLLGLKTYSQKDIPVQYTQADTNGNGSIETNEVQGMIDGFFIGTHDHGVMYIHNLIDFFFEQRID